MARRRSTGSAAASALLMLALCGLPAAAADGPPQPVIVLLHDDADVDAALAKTRRNDGIRPSNTFRHALRGYAASLTPGQTRRLEADSAVDAVVPDSQVELAAQVTPTGVARVGATRSPAAAIDGRDTRVDADVAIIDTGIQPNHPDLRVVGGYNCTNSSRGAWGDAHGHGTHVAGTVGALDNGSGVVGVAPGVRLWSVRVFEPSGFSRISWIVCGIDWVTSRRDPSNATRPLIEVANMSLRDEGGDDGNCGYTTPDAEHRAICRSVQAGTAYVVAAGNDRRTASQWRPASYDEVITVSALADFNGKAGGGAAPSCTSFGGRDVDDTFADFSNYGNDVDLIAPGVCIRSTYLGSSYGISSGTSMASPAVAGGAALYRSLHPDASPAEVRLALRAAGSDAWSRGTDRDSVHEPLLDVSSLGAPPRFALRSTATTGRTWAGSGTSRFDVALTRGNGFDGDITLSVQGAPPGMTAVFADPILEDWATGPVRLDIGAARTTPAGAYDLEVVGTSGALSHRLAIRVTVDVDVVAPVAATPRLSIAAPSTLGPVSVLLRETWSASDAGTGVASFEAQESRDRGPWTAVPLANPAALSRTLSGRLGGRIGERIRATDRVGNTGAWAQSAGIGIGVYQETAAITYSGSWGRWAVAPAWGGAVRYAKTAGASATIRFTGRGIGWVSTMSPYRGRANVYVDGVFIRTIDLRAGASRYKQVVFARELAYGTHSLRIVVAGTSGRPQVDLDGFVILH
jgi:subtilisin family serine protease